MGSGGAATPRTALPKQRQPRPGAPQQTIHSAARMCVPRRPSARGGPQPALLATPPPRASGPRGGLAGSVSARVLALGAARGRDLPGCIRPPSASPPPRGYPAASWATASGLLLGRARIAVAGGGRRESRAAPPAPRLVPPHPGGCALFCFRPRDPGGP